MADPFAAGLGALFGGPRSVAAVYLPSEGQPVAIRVIRGVPDETSQFGRGHVVQATNALTLQKSDAPDPRAGDLIGIGSLVVGGELAGGEILELVGEPIGDELGLRWRIGAEPISF